MMWISRNASQPKKPWRTPTSSLSAATRSMICRITLPTRSLPTFLRTAIADAQLEVYRPLQLPGNSSESRSFMLKGRAFCRVLMGVLSLLRRMWEARGRRRSGLFRVKGAHHHSSATRLTEQVGMARQDVVTIHTSERNMGWSPSFDEFIARCLRRIDWARGCSLWSWVVGTKIISPNGI